MFSRPSPEAHRQRNADRREANLQALMASRGTRASAITRIDGVARAVVKTNPVQHAGYMAAVRDLGYCMRCRCACRPQFCHKDQGKGMGMKTDCREGWPGCADCHWLVGTSGQYEKQARRALELELGQRTRAAITAAGTWPARLARWED